MHVLLLVFALHGSPARAAGDPWFGPDKVKHFLVSAFVETVSYSALRTARAGRDPALAAASAITLVVGLGKEWHDTHTAEGASGRDLAWDVAGIGAAAALLRDAR